MPAASESFVFAVEACESSLALIMNFSKFRLSVYRLGFYPTDATIVNQQTILTSI